MEAEVLRSTRTREKMKERKRIGARRTRETKESEASGGVGESDGESLEGIVLLFRRVVSW